MVYSINKVSKLSDETIIDAVRSHVKFDNLDNISRTNAYFSYYKRHREIKWSLLASMVSRNAGYNMTDLEGGWFPLCIKKELRHQIFITYERANWLIFQDAFSQLLIYEWSKKLNRPLFHLLSTFSVSPFMIYEWKHFWRTGDRNRLMTSLIINEQNLIQKPIIEHPFYKKKVFHSFCFHFQDWLHFSSVIFPTKEGDLYGISVKNFCNLEDRIILGKKLALLLFHPEYYSMFYEFADSVTHTGARKDYEHYLKQYVSSQTLPLRLIYPVINHNQHRYLNWEASDKKIEKWFQSNTKLKKVCITNWYMRKQELLHLAIMFEHYMKKPSVFT
ncbi:DUF2515 domain-containing protein [Bacillus solimangrovi]|uniref:DUF2515 domain-containing protein n=1 Tax=Bacillus solimangrovi TaxID=1305675 RepID=A0A1E5LIG8_9BACI|nr:DUF2515 domain-containing protein [Bacillus solimangrovi]OEH93880.1 hypothetical protein BFG57_10430 [Bacillus solimangrovi]